MKRQPTIFQKNAACQWNPLFTRKPLLRGIRVPDMAPEFMAIRLCRLDYPLHETFIQTLLRLSHVQEEVTTFFGPQRQSSEGLMFNFAPF